MTWGFYTGACALCHRMVTGDFVGIVAQPAHMPDGDIQC